MGLYLTVFPLSPCRGIPGNTVVGSWGWFCVVLGCLSFGHMESAEKAREEPLLLCYLLRGSGSPLGWVCSKERVPLRICSRV